MILMMILFLVVISFVFFLIRISDNTEDSEKETNLIDEKEDTIPKEIKLKRKNTTINQNSSKRFWKNHFLYKY